MVRTDFSAFPYCLPIRDLVAGDTLYALIGDGAVAALRQVREPAPATPANPSE